MKFHLSIEEAFDKGIKAQREGRIKEADQFYTAILKASPEHSDANHNMGVLAVSLGKIDKSIPFFQAALKTNSSVAQYWFSLVDALTKLNQFDDAEKVLNNAMNSSLAKADLNRLGKKLNEVKSRQKLNKNKEATNLDKIYNKKFKSLVKLYNNGHFNQVLINSLELLKDYPKSYDLLNMCGIASSGLAKYDSAIDFFNQAIEIKPDFAECYSNLGTAQQKNGKYFLAIEAFQKALKIKPDNPVVYYNLGAAFKKSDRLDEAIESYHRAITLNPKFAQAYNNLGITYYEKDDFDKAIENYNKALEIFPSFVQAYNNMGTALHEKGELEHSVSCFEEALKIEPNSVEAYSNCCSILEKWNRLERLAKWLQRAKRQFSSLPDDIKACEALLKFRNCQYHESDAIAKTLSIDKLSSKTKIHVYEIKAKVADKLKNYDEAYHLYYEMNEEIKSSRRFNTCNPDKYFYRLKNSLTQLKEKKFSLDLPKKQKLSNKPTFLIGFPRSGTTLLDTILRSHTSIDVVEEQPLVETVKRLLEKDSTFNYIDQFPTESERINAAKLYIKQLKENLTKEENPAVKIDKFPLNILRLPLTNFLFPEAKYILMIRHPLDSTLSNWMQNYKLNDAMANMVDIDRIVDFYCLTMEFFSVSRDKFNLDIHIVRYEDLIADMKYETTKLLRFLNLDWQAALNDYQSKAFERGKINTPSYFQVIQPLYHESSFRWKRYKKHLSGHLAKLEPWVNVFNYDSLI